MYLAYIEYEYSYICIYQYGKVDLTYNLLHDMHAIKRYRMAESTYTVLYSLNIYRVDMKCR